MATRSIDDVCVDSIRILSAEMVQAARSGHPGAPMGAADMAYVLWKRHLKHDPAHPSWMDRDRFVLSPGHASALLYSLLHLFGYDLPLEEIKNFRQWGSRTPGHPEHGLSAGVEMTTGPLGQGFAHGVGLALAERWLATRFNSAEHPVIDHYTYAIVSDGDLQEGVSAEAASLAGHLALGKLIYLYDSNAIQIEGSTDLAFSEDVAARFSAQGWQVLGPIDGHDHDAVDQAICDARDDAQRPTLIICSTHIAFGSPSKQDSASAHGAPLGEEEVEAVRQRFGRSGQPAFQVPHDVREFLSQAASEGKSAHSAWCARWEAYAKAEPEAAAELSRMMSGKLPAGWDHRMLALEWKAGEKVATRAASGKALQAVAGAVEEVIGGSADLAPSNKTWIEGKPAISSCEPGGRNLHFGVREHAMGSILGGMAVHGGIIPYGGTFLVFADYMRPPMRLAALMEQRVIYVLTHDSIGVGEDGPTHQPIEHLASLRAMPGLAVVRPADATETVEAWRFALLRENAPTALVLSRQGLPVIDRENMSSASGLHRGAYVLAESSEVPELLILASGSEISIAIEAYEALVAESMAVRLVSMPCWEAFRAQPRSYRDAVLPPAVRRRVAIEAGCSQGWHEWIGLDGRFIGMDRFGASAPAPELFRHFGLTSSAVIEACRHLLAECAGS